MEIILCHAYVFWVAQEGCDEGREEVKVYFWSREPLTCRSEDNVEQVKWVVYGDRRLTVRMIVSWARKRIVYGKLSSKNLACLKNNGNRGAESNIYRTRTTSLFIWSRSVWHFLFHKIKGIIKETCFEGVETLKRAVTMGLRGIPEESFQQCIEAWEKSTGKCVRLQGYYFEGETMCFVVWNWNKLLVTLVQLLFSHIS